MPLYQDKTVVNILGFIVAAFLIWSLGNTIENYIQESLLPLTMGILITLFVAYSYNTKYRVLNGLMGIASLAIFIISVFSQYIF